MCGHSRFANTLPSNQKNLFPSHGMGGWLQASTHWGLLLKLITQSSRKQTNKQTKPPNQKPLFKGNGVCRKILRAAWPSLWERKGLSGGCIGCLWTWGRRAEGRSCLPQAAVEKMAQQELVWLLETSWGSTLFPHLLKIPSHLLSMFHPHCHCQP